MREREGERKNKRKDDGKNKRENEGKNERPVERKNEKEREFECKMRETVEITVDLLPLKTKLKTKALKK